jgi:hypothetical protein
MFEQKRLCGDRAYATGAEQLREGHQNVDREDEEFAHGTNATMIASTRKTAPHSRIPSYCEFATHRHGNRQRRSPLRCHHLVQQHPGQLHCQRDDRDVSMHDTGGHQHHA